MLARLRPFFGPRRHALDPIGAVADRRGWDRFMRSRAAARANREDEAILAAHARTAEWTLRGYSAPARQEVAFGVDQLYGGQTGGGGYMPNLRERLMCPVTNLNNRQRLIAGLITRRMERSGLGDVYFMEQVTPVFQWAKAALRARMLVGSEYVGPQHRSGEIVGGIRHEDLDGLSFADASLDLIVSCDVFEHIPDPARGFSECARVLRRGGEMMMTVPFFPDRAKTVRRAELRDGALVHLLPPVYHGNPMSADGSLVFCDFGWDFLDTARASGFRSARLEIHHSVAYGHLWLQSIFRFVK